MGIPLKYYVEKEPLGTAGAIRQIDNLDDNFLMMNGDILTDLNSRNSLMFTRIKKRI